MAQIHDGNLSKKHKLGALKGASGTQEGKSLEELLETAIQTARDDANPSTCGALSQSAGSAVLAELQSIAPVFDVMTQGAPFAVSIAWGAVHLLIVVSIPISSLSFLYVGVCFLATALSTH